MTIKDVAEVVWSGGAVLVAAFRIAAQLVDEWRTEHTLLSSSFDRFGVTLARAYFWPLYLADAALDALTARWLRAAHPLTGDPDSKGAQD